MKSINCWLTVLKQIVKPALVYLIFSILLLSTASAQDFRRASKIGFVLPLSGEWASLGKGIQNAAVLAAEDLPQEMRPQLIFEDNHGDLSASVRSASELIDIEKVNAIVSIISGVAQVIKPLADRKNVISIGICSDTSIADGKFAFINYLTAEQGAESYLDYLMKSHTAPTSLSILQMNDSGFTRITNQLRVKALERGVKIERVESYDKGLSDFRPILLKLSRVKPATIALLGLSPELELVARQAKELNLSLNFSSIESFGLISDASLFEGSWFVDSAYPVDEFVERYEKRFNAKISAGVGHAYETVKLIARSFNNSNPLRSFQDTKNSDGVLGKLSVGKEGIISTLPTIKIIRDSRPVRVVP
jgi:ABC-type branched-subunit amino acid transport system substrate-binding protein